MPRRGKRATHGDLAEAGFTKEGIKEGSVGANMMSHADTTGHGKVLVSELQSPGAKGQGIGGKGARHGDLAQAGFTKEGITKGSVAASMMSDADTTGHGKDLVSELQSPGAKGQGIGGKGATHGDLAEAGFTKQGITKSSVASDMMSDADTTGHGRGLVSELQSAGAKGQGIEGKGATYSDLEEAGFTKKGIKKDSVAAKMMSEADTTGRGKDLVKDLQRSAAKGQGVGVADPSRGALDDAGLTPGGVKEGSPGAHMQSNVDKSGVGERMKASLQSKGTKK